MNADLPIRPATAADLPAVVALINQAYRGEGGPVGWTAEGHLLGGPRTNVAELTDLLSRHAAAHAAVLLAHDETGHLVGSVFVHPQPDALYLGLLGVAPAQQGRHVGRQLLQAAEAYGRQHRRPVVRMTVLDARPELLAWYLRRGYQLTGRTEQLPLDGAHGQAQDPLVLQVLEKSLAE
ncbi:GNAT family N-acetyltransferase [Hymenobacter sp. 15J16-1T3B]|uniref:GNAT family N-acetyltransferase n=1 Tax=Hymenobacter sp. 15J16-1T3B TaxID=2886941 RepID=UPI001D12EA77|nr:GNAT family N-acetyltransferase [Hymenobacter sp. 15J16-1T3B]MCC3159173.1 GNAT family N-acetyltransferase [Hymenobacter sp. 15J16-1T3B]